METVPLNVPQVLIRSLQLLLQHPIGVLWVLIQALLVSFFTLGIYTGPMQVGLFSVLLHYVRNGEWAPNELWGKMTSHNLPAGIVFVAMQVAVLLIGVPLSSASPLVATLFTFAAATAITLLWFYTFQILSDHDKPWTQAMREGWHLIGRGNWGAHLLLIVVLNLLNLIPTDTVGPILQIVILLILNGFATLAQTVAYSRLEPEHRADAGVSAR
ncbi:MULTISPECIES: hypothetical protein [Meiothermus]|uniref:Uncharacterized protein n=1 Tax=Meiothermus granaticius NBRC 107808 TaxID=1227551 RepID=A0A399F9C1_9DEIN|nr:MULTISPECIES: hypothetical protein [Meiothermus]MCL6529839.1 hypothetical protein [Meiothermus ruber]RIH93244.1 hypothetical protein Mgrana_00871 [Meiothermus granaticius NBRC 107808]GEM86437.1 hypothetical protein MGR01S_10620 [Meiothermus granaticius NBRC 107808]